MPALVVLNARSGTGSGPEQLALVRELFALERVQAQFVLARSAGDLLAAVDRACAAGIGMVVAGGGDGTQSAVAARLAGRPIVQGVLPLGTLNHFAKDLGIPLELPEAVRVLAHGQVKQVDVGEVNGRVFINNSSLGLYPGIVRERDLQQRHLGKSKWRALASATLHATRGRPGLAVRVDAQGEQQVRRTPFVFVGNNHYTLEGLGLGERTTLEGGTLSLVLGRRRGRLALVQLALRALLRRLRPAEDFEVLAGAAFVVTTAAGRIRVAADGEVCMMDTPLHYRIRPRALRVQVPVAGRT